MLATMRSSPGPVVVMIGHTTTSLVFVIARSAKTDDDENDSGNHVVHTLNQMAATFEPGVTIVVCSLASVQYGSKARNASTGVARSAQLSSSTSSPPS